MLIHFCNLLHSNTAMSRSISIRTTNLCFYRHCKKPLPMWSNKCVFLTLPSLGSHFRVIALQDNNESRKECWDTVGASTLQTSAVQHPDHSIGITAKMHHQSAVHSLLLQAALWYSCVTSSSVCQEFPHRGPCPTGPKGFAPGSCAVTAIPAVHCRVLHCCTVLRGEGCPRDASRC